MSFYRRMQVRPLPPRRNAVTHPDGTVTIDTTYVNCHYAVVAAPVTDLDAHIAGLTARIDLYAERIAVMKQILARPAHTVTITRYEQRDGRPRPDLDTISHWAVLDDTPPTYGEGTLCNINGLVKWVDRSPVYALDHLLDQIRRQITGLTETRTRLMRRRRGESDPDRKWQVTDWASTEREAQTAMRSRSHKIDPARLSVVPIDPPKTTKKAAAPHKRTRKAK